MAEKSFWRRKWKLILNVVTFLALAVLVYAIRHQLVQTLHDLRHINVWILLLIIPIEALNYHAQAKLLQSLFRTVNEEIAYRDLFRVALEHNFVNHVFPSGGVSGISYLSLRLRSFGVRAGKAALVQVLKLGLVFLSFEILLLLGMFILAAAGRASNLTIFIGTTLSVLLVVGTGLFVYVIGSRSRINSFLTGVTRLLNRLIHVVRPKYPETINIGKARATFDDLHENYKLFKARTRELYVPFWYGLLVNVTEVLAVYIVYIAFGHLVNVGAVILAYAIANFAGLVSVLPGGVGVYEALMTAVLSSAGVPAALSLPVTVMYRVTNTIVQVPLGFVLYHKALKGEGRA